MPDSQTIIPAPKSVPSPPPPASVRFVWSVAVAACILTVLATSLIVTGFHQREIGNARHMAESLDVVLAEETTRTLQNVTLVLDVFAEDVARDGISTPDEYARLRSGKDTHDLLRARSAGLPQLDAITVVGADGRLLNFSRDIPLPDANLSDRDYFRQARDEPNAEPFLSEPVANRGNGIMTSYVVRRIAAPDGTFLGLVLGAIDIGYFQRFYASLSLEKGTAVALWRSNGTLLSRVPALPEGTTVRNPPWLGAAGTDRGVYESLDHPTLPTRIVAFRKTPRFGVVVSVSIDRKAALADWFVIASGAGATAFLLVVAILLVAFLFTRHLRTHEALATAVAAREWSDAGRDAAEAQLRQAQKMEAVGHLTGGIAHDFNNMLAIVVGSLDVMGRRLDKGLDVRPLIDSAMEGANRAAALTQRLLAFSRRQQLAPKVLEAGAFMSEAAELVERTIGKGLRFRVEAPSGRWRIKVDRSQLENAILNLALNARDAMPNGGEIVLRTTYAKLGAEGELPGGDHVVVSVSDTGCGMDADTVARAIEPFFTTKDVGQGTGLGLSQVYGFASQSGGRLRIESAPGAGTTVSIMLPRTNESVERERVADAVPRARHSGETVLLVDDEESVRRTAAEMLRDLGYQVVQESDPESALEAVSRMPDLALLLTDVVMPTLDGRTLAAQARERRPGLAVLFATGQSLGSGEPGARVLAKPFDMRRLAEAVRSSIDAPRTDVRTLRVVGA